jgi:bacterioferritin-associated ferredoxin
MKADDELCLCFHVTRRKVEQYIRAERPAVASQLSECYGAGTGCGWCRPFLERLHAQILALRSREQESAAGESAEGLPEAADYAAGRAAYRHKGSPAADDG